MFVTLHKRADKALDHFVAALLAAKTHAETALEHAARAIEHHDAAQQFHAAQVAAAADLHNEAKAAIADVNKLLGADSTTEGTSTDGG